MDLYHQHLLGQTRRHFFGQCAVGLGTMALASLLSEDPLFGTAPPARGRSLADPRPTHHPARATNVIYLFMAGGPSQLDLFDPKPKLTELHGKPTPESYLAGKRFAFLRGTPNLLGSPRKFARHGECGAVVSECLPHFASVVDDLAIVRSLVTDNFNHGPAKIFMNTGSQQFGRPSLGAWVTYGIGSESRNLPGFIVLQSGSRGPRGGTANWGNGFLPTNYQGVPFLSGAEPILNLSRPKGVAAEEQKQFFDAVRELNLTRLAQTGDPEISARIAASEMAFRMQTSAPELIDLAKESKATLDLYGAEPGKPSFAANCLLARRLVERGVRFVQLYHADWDHHGTAETASLAKSLDARCLEVDRPMAALVKDLKQRGLLENTLVIWGGEFGRTPMGEPVRLPGRDHHIDAFTYWLAGGGIRPGITLGATDELGFRVTEDRVHVHDLQATILHCLGLDHKRLTFRFQGRDFRLTDVHGEVVRKILL
jgi:hypothetical protein